MEAIIVRAINGDKIGALFVENQEIYLADIRRQMVEEIDEFLPEKFHFMSVWEVPISSVQEKKITLKHALHPDGCLIIKPDQVEETGKRTLNEDEGESATTSLGLCESNSVHTSHTTPAKKKAKVQSTLTSYFGASSKPEIRHPTALVRQGVYIYKECEIEEVTGNEKKRRIFWNEKSDEICRNEKYNSLKADEIDQLLHEKWRLHKASLLEEENQVVTSEIEKLLLDNPEIVSKLPSSRAVKSHTIIKNFERLDSAKKAVEKSRLSLDEQHTKCQQQEKIRRKQEMHRDNRRELQKAEDALRQCLDVKKRYLSDIIKKIKQ
jgi:hypothetical protein